MTGPADESGIGITAKGIGRLSDQETAPTPFVSPRPRERLLRIALMMTVAAAALSALAAIERYRFASEALRLGAVSPAREDAVAQHRTITYILVAVLALSAAALWLWWFSQVYGNLLSLGGTRTRLYHSSALVCCVLPIVNVFVAPRLIAEAWHVSDPRGDRRRYPEDAGRWPAGLAAIWSPVALLTVVVAAFGLKLTPHGLDQLEPVRSGSLVEVGAAMFIVTTALLTARVAAGLTARQEARAAHLEDTA